jgi:hypothetical protein
MSAGKNTVNKLGLRLAMLAFIGELQAQELTVGAGAMHSPDSPQSSYAWHVDYRRRVAPSVAWSATWLNEGHVQQHHRDGIASQLWLESRWPHRPAAVALGLGAYYYFDTQQRPDGDSEIERGWAPILSLSLSHYTRGRWFGRLTVNTVLPADNITVNTLTLALGYRIGNEFGTTRGNPVAPVRQRESEPHNELTVLAGKTVVNASVGDRGLAGSMEYRRHFSRHVQGTLSLLEEGDADVLHRRGTTAQAWLVDAWFERRLTLGLGGGVYYSRDGRREDAADRRGTWMGIVSPTVAFEIGDGWIARAIWHRVITKYHRDTDVFLAGAGRRW